MILRILLLLKISACCYVIKGQQIANYVTNGSFEKYRSQLDCSSENWEDLDSISLVAFSNDCYGNSPNFSFSYQLPRTGKAAAFTTYYLLMNNFIYVRTYLRTKLKDQLEKDKVYCVKFYVSNGNNSTYGIDAFEAYFGDSLSLDTIRYGHLPLTYLSPQVRNPKGNIITDTLNWTAITGTFVANGTEKYLVVGNFESDANTDTLFYNPTNSPQVFCEASLDDVSCIPVDLPAYAGPDKPYFSGDSVYIGRELDFAVDPYCYWYKLPNMTTTIDTASGLWVKPTATSTYVVRQELECNSVKWDTVVVYEDGVGIDELKMKNEKLKMNPNPANDEVELSVQHAGLAEYFQTVEIVDVQGRLLKEVAITSADVILKISTSDLESGVYLLRLLDAENETVVVKKLAVQR